MTPILKKIVNAKFFSHITYQDVIQKDLRVMDLTAIALCRRIICRLSFST